MVTSATAELPVAAATTVDAPSAGPTADATSATAAVIPNSLWKSPRLIAEGDLVILFEHINSLTYCYVTAHAVFNNRHGAFYHDDMIGRPFGATLRTRQKNARGYMILLAPTPELWSRALRHRTQIVFTLDASAIMFSASLRSGSRVVESGTGSGALTTSFARTVAPHGHVFTFEFNPTRAEIAREEFARNGLADVITVDCRDACEQGFPDELAGSIDLVFLDLPCPWKAIDHSTKMLKQGGNFASYSPCIEQVQKTCGALREAGYEMIRTIETRLIPYQSRRIDLPTPDFGLSVETVTSTTGASTSSSSATIESASSGEEAKAPGGKKRRFTGEYVVAKKDDEIRGHTAFLTFAVKFFE
ncbi:hypothetical protein PybrP1_012255 [[Pythium] brassicae (nom. inval.)]|nr:hypothetical protein PybrP1_012255 [[Pythium] brassicae (nom. inval.)]